MSQPTLQQKNDTIVNEHVCSLLLLLRYFAAYKTLMYVLIQFCCLQLRNILWECAFAKDVGQAPEEALAPYMEHPSVDPIVKARVPHPWDPEIFISRDLHIILEIVDWLSEQLN